MKYTDTYIGFREFPDEISLLINISGCKIKCPSCHSPELWEDIGTELTFTELDSLIEKSDGITCIGLMGGNPKDVNSRAFHIHMNYPDLKVGWYYGGNELPEEIELDWFNYIKLGPYIDSKGPLDNPNTNQRMYEIDNGNLKDITYKFWKYE